jgi:DNA ligase (NAD+)
MAEEGSRVKDPRDMAIEELEDEVRYHNQKYWVDHAPVISDYEYDRLVEALKDKAPDSPVLQAIGPEGGLVEEVAGTRDTFEKVEHSRPMLSLDKCYSDEDLFKWWDKFEGDAFSPKVDGVAAALRYDAQGRLALGATRGNGRIGDNVTENLKRVEGVPARIGAGPLEVRGEVYMPLSVFNARWADQFANPRNLTAGALKQKEPDKTRGYGIRFLAYSLDPPPGRPCETEVAKQALLVELGFTPVEQERVSRAEAVGAYQRLLAQRDTWDYETDGVVFKVDLVREHDRLGATSHHPRYALAYKFQGETGVSTLRDVLWSVSRTGALNPVAVVDPVELSGVTVTRASLHNLAIMRKLGGEGGLTLGARVLMMRRGGVIPHVEQVVEPGDGAIERPEACPHCGGPTYVEDDVLSAHHTASCPATRLGQLQHFVRVIDTRGFGPKVLAQLIEHGLVSEPADLYRLTVEPLMRLERLGQKSAEKLVEQMSARRRLRFDVFLQALGIDDLGPHVAGLLARRFEDPEAILAAGAEALAEIHGVGKVIAERVVKGLEERRELIEHLRAELDTLELPAPPSERPAEGPLGGAVVLFTGALERMKRAEAQSLVESLGGKAASGVTREVTHLVLGDADLERFRGGWRSSKLKKAEELNDKGAAIEILGESDFFGRLEEPGA